MATLRLQFLSVFLTLSLFFPYGLKLAHAIEFHIDIVECSHKGTHFHEAELHSELLDYCFLPITVFASKNIDEVLDSLVRFQPSGYILNFQTRASRIPSTRGPPSFFV